MCILKSMSANKHLTPPPPPKKDLTFLRDINILIAPLNKYIVSHLCWCSGWYFMYSMMYMNVSRIDMMSLYFKWVGGYSLFYMNTKARCCITYNVRVHVGGKWSQFARTQSICRWVDLFGWNTISLLSYI